MIIIIRTVYYNRLWVVENTEAAVLTITSGMLFAENDIVSNRIANENTAVTLAAIAPVTPAEATFEDISTLDFDFANLAPAMPMEADFSDVAPVATIDLSNLAPAIPAEADFSDAIDILVDIQTLIPTIPGEADFNDSIDTTIEINTLAPSTPIIAEFE